MAWGKANDGEESLEKGTVADGENLGRRLERVGISGGIPDEGQGKRAHRPPTRLVGLPCLSHGRGCGIFWGTWSQRGMCQIVKIMDCLL